VYADTTGLRDFPVRGCDLIVADVACNVRKGCALKPINPSEWFLQRLFGSGLDARPFFCYKLARKIRHKSMPEWAEGLYYNSGNFNEVLVYHDDEAIYVEHLGKEDGVVRFTFEMIEGLKIVEDEEEPEDAPQ
jgi:hypothetical protein